MLKIVRGKVGMKEITHEIGEALICGIRIPVMSSNFSHLTPQATKFMRNYVGCTQVERDQINEEIRKNYIK